MLSTNAAIERSVGAFEAKFGAELIKNSTKLLEGQPFDLGIPVSMSFESKALDAAINSEKWDLKLAAVTVSIDGDFSKWMGIPNVEVKGTVQAELSLGPEAARKLVELARHARDLESATKYEAKVAATEKKLERLRVCAKGTCSPEHRREIKKLESELAKLKPLRGKFVKIRSGAVEGMRRVAQGLEKTAGGRLVKKAAATVAKKVFAKFLPVYGWISAAQDIYDVATKLADFNWSGIGDKIMNGGDVGTTFGDGTNREDHGQDGSSGAALSEAELGDASVYEQAVENADRPQLHPSAKQVMELLTGGGSTDASTSLSPEAIRDINTYVPLDLTTAEIEQMKSLVASIGEREPDIVKSVIVALDVVRPDGRQQPTVGPSETRPAPDVEKRTANTQNVRVSRRPSVGAEKSGASSARTHDLVEYLRARIRVEPDGDVDVPNRIVMDGFRARVIRKHSGYAGGSSLEDLSYNVQIILEVEHLTIPVITGPGSVFAATGEVSVTIFGVRATPGVHK